MNIHIFICCVDNNYKEIDWGCHPYARRTQTMRISIIRHCTKATKVTIVRGNKHLAGRHR